VYKRKIFLLIILVCAVFGLTACKEAKEQSDTPTEVTEHFFSAFETSDYEKMKAYCTENCIDLYFHEGDVNGMVRAKAQEIGEEETENDQAVYVFVTVEMETAKTSALYPETETSFYVKLIQKDGSWLIDSFPTGK
jgi:ABC-type oligopeptide transport system substrate-binding subunit